MQKKFVLVFILLSVKCFTSELRKYEVDSRTAVASFKYFAGEPRKYAVDSRIAAATLPDISQEMHELKRASLDEGMDYSLNLDNYPLDLNIGLNKEDPRLTQLRQRGIPEKDIFRRGSYLYKMERIDYVDELEQPFMYHAPLESATTINMLKNGHFLFEASALGEFSRVQLLLNCDTCVNYLGLIKARKNDGQRFPSVGADGYRLGWFLKNRFLKLFPKLEVEEDNIYVLYHEYLTPLECALINKDKEIINLLLENCGKARAKYIVFYDDPSLVDIVLKKPFITAYEVALEAAKNSKNKILTYLLKREEFSQEQLGNLLEAYSQAKNFNYESLKFLLEHSKKERSEELNRNILSNVVHDSRALELVYSYISSGVDSALRKAFEIGNISSMEFLFKHGANPNLILNTRTGETLLMKAAERGSLRMVKLLVANGAKRDAIGILGNNAGVIALQSKHEDIYDFLNGDRSSCCML